MKRNVLLILLAFIFGMVGIAKADEFIMDKNLYYGKSYNITYADYAGDKIINSNRCVICVSYNGGETWKAISDTALWIKDDTLPANKYARALFIPAKVGGAKLGLFANPDQEGWVLKDFKDVKILAASITFSYKPTMIYKNGAYTFQLMCLNTNSLPDVNRDGKNLSIRYTLDSGWHWTKLMDFEYPQTYGLNLRSVRFTNNDSLITGDAFFKVTYMENEYPLSPDEFVPFTNYKLAFHFNLTDKIHKTNKRLINQSDVITWEKSPAFSYLTYKVLLNGNLIYQEEIDAPDTKNITFDKYGEYKVIGIATLPWPTGAIIAIDDNLIFNVGDPCDEIKAENAVLHDSIVVLNRKVEDWKKEANTRLERLNQKDSIIKSLNGQIEELNRKIRSLNEYIVNLKADSLVLKLIYKNGDISVVKDKRLASSLSSEIKTEVTGSVLVIKVLEAYTGSLTWWIFDTTGALLQSSFVDVWNTEITVSKPAAGAYFLYLQAGDKYYAYKFMVE